MLFKDYKIFNIDLYKHQKETISFYLKHKRCFIFDDIGTGKTLTILAATDFLAINEKIDKVLIVCPLSVLRSTWINHIINYFPYRKFALLYGSKAKRLQALETDVTYYVINTDGIKIIEKELRSKKFNVLVVDESTTFSTHKTLRTKAMWRLSKFIPSVVCMTGNPIPNDTLQSFAQAKIVNPTTAPKYISKYRDQLKIKLDMYNYIDRPFAVEIARSILQPAIRHKMADCVDLPPITHEIRDITLTKEQKKLYKSMEDKYVAEINDGVITAANAAVKALKLMQISVGILIGKDNKSFHVDNKNHLKELDNIIGQLPIKKIIIFATFTRSINNLIDHFDGKAVKIDGSVSAMRRFEIIKDFQEGDLEVLICQPAAIAHGVTLHAANTIVWFGPCYSNEKFIQCNGRIRRVGQTRPQLVIKFQATKIEKKIYEALEKKQKISNALLDLV